MSREPSFPPSPRQESVTFAAAGQALQLEGKLHRGSQGWGAVLCHPHPLHGGSMNNKVIDAAMRAVSSMQGSALRFNFRGVGRSEGSYGEGIEEVRDVEGAIQFLQEQGLTTGGLLLIGFSFGTGVLGRYLSSGDRHADGVVLIAPPLAHFQVPVFTPPERWGLHMILGEHDQFCTPALLEEYRQKFTPPPARTHVVTGADHFFHGHLPEVVAFLQEMVG